MTKNKKFIMFVGSFRLEPTSTDLFFVRYNVRYNSILLPMVFILSNEARSYLLL